MKHFTFGLLATFFVLVAPYTTLADFNKTKIAVLDFQLQGESFENQDLGLIVAEWFITAMVREGRFDVVERRLLQKVLSEQQLAMSGIIDSSSATQLGKLLGVKVIISGSVMKLKDIIEINARIIDVESASIIAAENVKSPATNRLQDLVVDMSRKIIKNFPLEGYIVNRKKNSVTLDLGLRTGVKVGMKFIVFKEGQVIKHPKTGEVLDVERIETGTIKITKVRKKICKAKIMDEVSPGSVDYGQLVKSLSETTPNKETRLYVNTTPQNARIRILNITPRYERGMILSPGLYHVEVSATGFNRQKEWVTITSGKEKHLSFYLTPIEQQSGSTSYNPPPPSQLKKQGSTPVARTSQGNKYIRSLQSGSMKSKKDTARRITRARLKDTAVLDVLEAQLLGSYNSNTSNRNHIDTMAWFCKALGASKISKYKPALQQVANTTSSRKLRGYCQKSLNKM